MRTINPGLSEISTKFKQYNSDLFEIWEDYLLLDFYLPSLHEGIKNKTLPTLPFDSLFTEKQVPFTNKFLYGVIDRIKRKQVPERALLEAVSLTEIYLQAITFRVYRDFPYKLETKDETPDQQFKILKTIVDSNDKDEIIERLSEEKIRSIFYGKPVDFFKSDKSKIGVGDKIKSSYNLALTKFEEIIARRNIYTHNHGRVDRKYLREVPNTTCKHGEKLPITKDYLRDSIRVLLGLTAITTELVLINNYGATDCSERIKKYIVIFNKEYKGK